MASLKYIGKNILNHTLEFKKGNVSGSALSTGSFGRTSTTTLDLESIQGNWTNAGNTVADLGIVTTVDINGGTIDGITALTAGGDLDIGGHDLRAETITADALTSGRVVFAGSNGLLSDDSDLTFSGATLTATSASLNFLRVNGNITASVVYADAFQSRDGGSTIDFNDDINVEGDVSGSSTATGSFGQIKALEANIDGGTLDNISSLTAANNLDIGSHRFTAESIVADGMTPTRVLFLGSGGLLSDDSDMTFAGSTLSITNITTTGTIKHFTLISGSSISTGSLAKFTAIDYGGNVSGSSTSTGSFGRTSTDTLDLNSIQGNWTNAGNTVADLGTVTTVDINGGTIDGITALTADGDLDIGAHDLRAATITADSLTATRVPFAGTDGVLSDDSDLTFATATLSATNLTTTGTIKNMTLVRGSAASTGSFGHVQTDGNIMPINDNTQDLGSAAKRWANLFVGDLNFNNEGSEGNEIDGTTGRWTIQEGDENLYLLNRNNGKKYKFKLEEII